MKLNLSFMLIDLLIILAIPLVFVWSTLLRISKAVFVLHTARRRRGQYKQSHHN